jgi:quercetin dioxygenase-like cupin family protein
MAEPSKRTQVDPGRAYALAQLVAFQDEAIVSRIVYKGAGGQMTVFAFAAGQELTEHTSPFDAFVQVLEGRVELRIGGAPVEAGPGDLALMPGGVPHAVRALSPFKMLLTMYRK